MTNQHPEPVTIEEIADRLVPSDPRISPNGRHIAFTVATSGRKDKRHDRAIWLSTDGQPARRFTGGSGNNQSPRWSPDSNQILFVGQREEGDDHRIYLLPVAGGEAQRLGTLEGTLSKPSWSPDGTRIAVLRTDPETDAEKKRKEDKDDAILFEEEDKVDRLWVIEPESGEARCLTHGKRHVWDYAWSHDGEHLVLVTGNSPTPNEMFRGCELRVVPASGGASRNVISFRSLATSPVVRTVNGKEVIAVVVNDHRDDPSDAVWLVPFEGGRKSKLIENERAVTYDIVPDPASADGLLALQGEGSRVRHYRLSCTTGELSPIPMDGLRDVGSSLSTPSIAPETGELALTWSTFDTPEEVYRVSADGGFTKVTSFGTSFEGCLAQGEIVTWEARDGVDIEGVLIYPLEYREGSTYPLLVQIHGGPAWHWLDRINMSWHDWAQMMAAEGFAVLLPNPRGSIGYGSAFEQLLQDDVGGGESTDLIDGALAMVERGIADRDRLAIGGWSWGGYLTAWTITRTDIFRAAVMGAGVANNVSDHGAGDIAEYNTLLYPNHPYYEEAWDYYTNISPVRHASKVVTPTLIVHGENDVRVHVTQGQEYYRALQVVGVETRFVRYPREGHSFQEYRHQVDLMERIRDWLIDHTGETN